MSTRTIQIGCGASTPMAGNVIGFWRFTSWTAPGKLVASMKNCSPSAEGESTRLQGFTGGQVLRAAYLRGAGFVGNFAIEKMDSAFGVLRVARVVSNHANGRAVAVKVAKQIHHGVAIF